MAKQEGKESNSALSKPDILLPELLKIAVNSTTDGIALLDSDSKYYYLNRAHIEQFGYSDESELIGKTWHVFYDESEIKRAESEIFPVLMEKGSWRGETIGISKKGEPVYQEITLTALEDGGLICVTRILDDLKKIERQLRASNLSISSIVHHATSGILLESANRIVVESNRELGVLIDLDLDPKLLRGTNCVEGLGIVSQQFKDPDDFLNGVEDLVANQIPVFNQLLELEDGSFLERDFIPLTSDNEVQGFLWMYRDVTEYQRTTESLKNLVTKEKELNEMRSKLVRTVSHEFKKPILNTLTSIELLQRQLETSGEHMYSQAMNHIVTELKGLNESVSKLVKYETLYDRSETSKRPVNARKLVTNYLQYHFKLFMLSEKFEIEELIESEEISIDIDLFNLALKNVIENALKYSGHSDKIKIKTEVIKNTVCLSFTNPLTSKTKPDKSQLGTPLYRANPGDDKGLGLGLGIIQHSTELLGGFVHYEVSEDLFQINLHFPIYHQNKNEL